MLCAPHSTWIPTERFSHILTSPFRIRGSEVRRGAVVRSETRRSPPYSFSSSLSLPAATWSAGSSKGSIWSVWFLGSDCHQHLRSLHGGTLRQQRRLANMVSILCVGWGMLGSVGLICVIFWKVRLHDLGLTLSPCLQLEQQHRHLLLEGREVQEGVSQFRARAVFIFRCCLACWAGKDSYQEEGEGWEGAKLLTCTGI